MNSRSKNRLIDKVFSYVGIGATLFALGVLGVFIFDIAKEGIPRIDLDFITRAPSTLSAKRAGIWPALNGTLWVFGITALFAIPVGIGAGIYLEEYMKKSKLSQVLELNLSNLAGVPSVIYGLLGLAFFKGVLGFKTANVVVAGGFTLALLVLPVIIVATREALRAVPHSIREASYGLGATKWQTIWNQVLPSALGGVMTGTILALSRAIGETAPLLILGVVLYIKKAPSSPMDLFTVLPMQIYNWVQEREEFMANASGAIIILLAITFALNGIAIYIRNRQQKKINW